MSAQLARVALALACAALCLPAGAAPPAQRRVYLPQIITPATDPDLAAVAEAAAGLMYPSETDAPLTPLVAPPLSSPAEVCASEARPGEPVELGTVARALAGPTTTQPWMSAEELTMAARFAALRDTIEARLSGAISCRVGRTQVRVLILGVSSHGLIVGLRTIAVET